LGPVQRWPATTTGIGIIIDPIITTFTRRKSVTIIVTSKEMSGKNSKTGHIVGTHLIDTMQDMVKKAIMERGIGIIIIAIS
jgi:hypothetical protein